MRALKAEPPLAVLRWPGPGAGLVPQQDLLVLALDTPHTTNRESARQRVRAAVAELLGARLGCTPAAVRLRSVPGRPLRVEGSGMEIGLSVSHEPGLSLAAIRFGGPVGVDLLQVPPAPVWRDDIPALARDYLGPEGARELAARPAAEQVACFARQWTVLEASLKCAGRALEEWSPAVQQLVAGCRRLSLALPAGYAGSLALPVGGTSVRRTR